MKHAGSNEDLKLSARRARRALLPGTPGGQSLTSVLVALALGLLLVAVLLDAPVRTLAQSLDPSVRIALRQITGFGNSAWPLGIGLALLGVVWFVKRRNTDVSSQDLATLRSALILLVLSVAISGLLASLSKHVIGRIRPSKSPDAEVLEFVFMAFQSGWAAFPSGHSTTAMAAALALALCFPRHSWSFLALGLFAALSRALLGVHWFSDCVAGVGLGVATTMVIRARMTARGHRMVVAKGVLPRVLIRAVQALGQRVVKLLKAA